MEEERKKQERDLDAAMRARLDRRKKRLEGRGKTAVKEEQRAVQQAVEANVAADTRAKAEALEREAE